MLDNQIVETLENIKYYCDSVDGCYECKFKYLENELGHCQIKRITEALDDYPCCWDIEKISEALKK